MNLAGKTVIVTGAASGIGAATAKLLKERGASVIALDRTRPDFPVDTFHSLDLLDEASISACISKIEGKSDALCNIAGVPPTAGEATTLRVNFIGLRSLTLGLLSKLSKTASIVNLSSGAGALWAEHLDLIRKCLALGPASNLEAFCEDNGIVGAPSYMFSKEVLNVWTLQMAARHRQGGIRVNAVCPGPVDTPILKDFIASFGQRAIDGLSKVRAGLPEEIAPVVAFLCSDESRWVNGALIPVDGSLEAQKLAESMGFQAKEPID